MIICPEYFPSSFSLCGTNLFKKFGSACSAQSLPRSQGHCNHHKDSFAHTGLFKNMVIIILRKIILGLPYFNHTMLSTLFTYDISLACEKIGHLWASLQPVISLFMGTEIENLNRNPLKLGYPFFQANQTGWSSSACQ